MSERFKYSHNGICKIPNILETIATTDHTPEQTLFETSTAKGRVYLIVWETRKFVYPVAYLKAIRMFEYSKVPPKTPMFLNILSKNPKFENKFKLETFSERAHLVDGPEIPFSDLLNAKNGFLDENGAMTIEYGFHFDAILDENQKIWKFNLKSKLFDSKSKKNMITYEKGKEMLYSHKQLILFHDSRSRIYCATRGTNTFKLYETIKFENFENCLQIAHGVQLKLDSGDLLRIISYAHHCGFQNVLKYCERQLVMKFSEYPDEFPEIFSENPNPNFIFDLIQDAVNFDLNHLFAFLLDHLLKNSKFKNQNSLEKLNLDKMTKEPMKMIVASVLYGKY
ncbi:hypothetical protein B9Z55_026789 [Caenorhabditis nigoni]|uniref:BTB domain-containing protein n=1 Tax=Caenorhabditis nigoni TaxID=1611254 RepID=A0A2G5SHK0_9PELO|nr:hypothetical protein B9Z55_026789 [Caenorhabditis nigoni]